MSHWQASSGPAVARNRAQLLQRVRQYFAVNAVLEVDTPALSFSAPTDVHIESFAVRNGRADSELYLHTSPEFCMKRLLADGYPDIYSLCRVFRDGELGARHQPEFTMLEWYRLDFELEAIVEDTVHAISVALDDSALRKSVSIVDYTNAFVAALGLNPITATLSELIAAADVDAGLQAALGDHRDDWLDLLLTRKVVPSFSSDTLTVLQHYPASQAALARLCPHDTQLADRFEVFFGPNELANGYVELRDRSIQAQRFAADQAAREVRGSPQRRIDEKLLSALESGLPACAGVAIGVERLHMCYEKTDDIRNVIAFAFEDHHD